MTLDVDFGAKSIKSVYPYTIDGEFPGGDTGEYLEQLTLLSLMHH